MTELPLAPRDVVPLGVQEFTFVLDLEKGPDFADLCARFRDDTNRAVVWLLRFRALQALRDDLRLTRRADATGAAGSFLRGAFEVAATQPLNDDWEFDRPAFFAAVERSQGPQGPRGENVRIAQVDWDTLKIVCDALDRYAGWLNRERTSAAVRADVRALRIAIDSRRDPAPLLETLEADLARLPGGAVRRMLRAASQELRSAVTEQS